MNISTLTIESVAVIRLQGDLDTNTSPDAQEALNKVLAEGASKVLVNLADVGFVSSSGLRVLLVTAKKLGTASGELRVSNLNGTVNEVFEISGFSSIFNVFRTEEDALRGF